MCSNKTKILIVLIYHFASLTLENTQPFSLLLYVKLEKNNKACPLSSAIQRVPHLMENMFPPEYYYCSVQMIFNFSPLCSHPEYSFAY